MHIRVFLLDDHELLRRGVRELLEAEDDIEVVGETGSSVAGIALITELKPDVAIVDVRLPDGNGTDVCRQVRSIDTSIQCLILTAFSDDDAFLESIMAGAAGYVLKQVKGNDLVDAVRRVAHGESLLDPAITRRVMDESRDTAEPDSRINTLTRQERTILDLITEGLTNRQIGDRLHLAEKTVKNYISKLLAKLGVERRTEAAVLATRFSVKRGTAGSATTPGRAGDAACAGPASDERALPPRSSR